jgi:hypothetical protein
MGLRMRQKDDADDIEEADEEGHGGVLIVLFVFLFLGQ